MELWFSPACTTKLFQPAHEFVINRLKHKWSARWDEMVRKMISYRMWSDPCDGSWLLINLGKQFFLLLAADVAQALGQQRDREDALFTKNAMTQCRWALNPNEVWEEWQLKPELEETIAKYCENFNVQPIATDKELNREATASDDDTQGSSFKCWHWNWMKRIMWVTVIRKNSYLVSFVVYC